MQPSHRLIIGVSAAVMLLVGGATAGIFFFVLPHTSADSQTLNAIEMPGASAPYEPQSAWVEDGLDPEVLQLDLSGPEVEAPANSPWEDLDGVIRQHVHTRYNDLMPCYAKALEDEDLAGRVDIRFGVAPDGHVALVKVTGSELRSPETEDCLVDVARSWKFPPTGKSHLTQFDSDFRFSYD